MSRTAATMSPDSLVPLDKVYKMMESCPAQQKLLLVDACRNDPSPGGTRSIQTAENTRQFAESLQAPPQGILVMTACVPGQVSVEDSGFGHGVFMYFVMKGLEGAADRDGDRKVSLLELYQYSEVKTKTHVRLQRNLIQTPELSGKISGDYEIASVPRRVTAPLGSGDPRPATPGSTPQSTPADETKGVSAAVKQADEFFRQGNFENAIAAYSAAILIDPRNDEVYRKRGAAYLATGKLDKAVIDYQLGGQPVPLTVTQDRANLRNGKDVNGIVKKGQTLGVTKVQKLGDHQWLWVKSVDGNTGAHGWVLRDAVVKKTEPARKKPAATANTTPNANTRNMYAQPDRTMYSSPDLTVAEEAELRRLERQLETAERGTDVLGTRAAELREERAHQRLIDREDQIMRKHDRRETGLRGGGRGYR